VRQSPLTRYWKAPFRSRSTTLEPGRLTLGDLARLASVGLRTRRLRTALSALGIAIGVAAIVAVLGLSSSSSAGLLAEIDRLGTNLPAIRAARMSPTEALRTV
jgi:ABC-type lipoprotein release transport system permease subunit